MSLLGEMTYGLRQLIADQGNSITFRRVTTLPGANPAPNPPTYIGLVTDGTILTGTLTINMRVDLTQGGVFTGRLLPGDTFTLDGDSTIYRVNAQVISPSGADTLTQVHFTPVLTYAYDGTAVTLAFAADIPSIPASITSFASYLVNGVTVQASDRRVRFLASYLGSTVPVAGDKVIFANGDIFSVVRIVRMEIDGTIYGYMLQVRK
jgi:hypothetical protein